MANTARNKPGSEQTPVVEESKVLDNLMSKYEGNKKRINTIVTAALALIVGYFAYVNLYKEPRETKAATAVSYAQRYFEADSFDKALNGDGQHQGFLKIMKKYSGTSTANLCNYYAAVCYSQKGDFKNTVKFMEDFDGKGTLVSYAGKGLLGDAYMELNNPKKAMEAYEAAIGNTGDDVITPIYMLRLAMVCEMNNKPEDAKKYYHKIKDEYPQSEQAREVEKYLGMLGEHE
jgi:predicted negative regulator of RcsB-dependent stress response